MSNLKKSQRSLKNWTKQEWMTSGTYNNKKKGSSKEVKSKGKKRYLPKNAWSGLSSSEKSRTNRAKASSNKQHVKQPKSIANKTKQYRKEGGYMYSNYFKKGGTSKVNEAGNYTKPTMRKNLFNRIKAGSKGGTPGQWSARKAQMLAKRYKANGGGYKEKGGYIYQDDGINFSPDLLKGRRTALLSFKEGGNIKNGSTKRSDRKGKKMAVYMDGSWHHFGDSSMQDFRSHKSEKRKKAFYNRHRKNLQGSSPRAKAFRKYASKTWKDGGMTGRNSMDGVSDMTMNVNTELGHGGSIARTLNDYRNGLLNGKNVFKFAHGGKKNMTMNTPIGTIDEPIMYRGYTDGQLTDRGVALPGQDFQVDGDTVVENPIMKLGGLFNKKSNMYQMGGSVEEENIPDMQMDQEGMMDMSNEQVSEPMEEELEPAVDETLDNVDENAPESTQTENTGETMDLTNNPVTGNPMSFSEAYKYAQDNNLEMFMWKGKEYKNNKYKG